ncbi:jg20332 [Pararge aegeria aegeria]|uniref:Jg20332 protein n=1 Tax=Pararge aegeria aegeria TaxID=348720 RepID=A0A8S4R9W8_9NEOP|nr:jg20332 [Pararge aegeria aegeria]
MKLEWTESESDYGLEEAAFYEAPAAIPPAPRKHVSFNLRLELCDEGGGAAEGIKTEPPEAEEPRTMQKVPSLSDLTDPEASLAVEAYGTCRNLGVSQRVYSPFPLHPKVEHDNSNHSITLCKSPLMNGSCSTGGNIRLKSPV